MPSHTLHVVQAFEERDGGIVPLNRKHAPPLLPPVRWRLGLRRPTSVSSLGHGRAILI
jgi:hypothetical protein